MREPSLGFSAFELACVAVIVVTLGSMARARGAREVLVDYAALALAGFVGEETCIALYRYYAYAPAWHLRAHHVPLLVPLIWPLVILSARDVALALFPLRRRLARATLVAAAVVFDATLVEVLSVRAGFWAWAEGGLLGVPIVGILGWGYFAFGASLALDASRSRGAGALAVLALGPASAHAAILASWWALFRWVPRGELGRAGVVAHAALSLGVLALVVGARRAGRAVEREVWLPRLAATLLFVGVFAVTAASSPLHLAVLVATACPYLAVLRIASPRAP